MPELLASDFHFLCTAHETFPQQTYPRFALRPALFYTFLKWVLGNNGESTVPRPCHAKGQTYHRNCLVAQAPRHPPLTHLTRYWSLILNSLHRRAYTTMYPMRGEPCIVGDHHATYYVPSWPSRELVCLAPDANAAGLVLTRLGG